MNSTVLFISHNMSLLHKLPFELISYNIIPNLQYSSLFNLSKIFPTLNLRDSCDLISAYNKIPFPCKKTHNILVYSHISIHQFDSVISDIIDGVPMKKIEYNFSEKKRTYRTITNTVVLIKIIKAFSSYCSDSSLRANYYLNDYCSLLFSIRNPNVPNVILEDFSKYIISYTLSWEYAEVDYYLIYENCNLVEANNRSFTLFDNINYMSKYVISDTIKNYNESIKVLSSLSTNFSNKKIKTYLIFHIYSYINRIIYLHNKKLNSNNSLFEMAFLKINQLVNDIKKIKNLSFRLKSLFITELKVFENNLLQSME